MPQRSWTIIDVESDDSAPRSDQLGNDDFGIRRSTRQGGLSGGVDVLDVHNGDFKFRIVPTRGMGIWDAELNGERFGWRSPVRGPVHPMFVDLGEPSGLGWLDGFDELLVRCGLESNGAPEHNELGQLLYPLHGRIANKPAHRVTATIDDDRINIVGEVEESRFHFLKLRMVSTISTRRGESIIRVQDRIENLSASAAEIQMLYHVNFGLPLLDSGSQVVVPAKTIVPRNDRAAAGIGTWDSYEAPQPAFEEQVYFLELLGDQHGQTRALLKNAHSTRGASLVYSVQQLPCLSVWKNTTAEPDGYVTGIEPGTNFPNPRSYEGEQGRVAKIAGLGSTTFEIDLELHGSADQVAQASAAVDQLQGNATPQIHQRPQPGWCAP